ncbi:thioredoxin family protein [Rhodoblastus sp.]|jgi:thiol-disulfide isomerase/thioredoxin|uniref:thioredoxin family protein n=1 Tax=Rhodoblastus sp. TaxID=1962975 RepID=UPI0025EDD44F|nr:thioredoxin family protein [Rhodoblastus sp.]
MQDRRLFLAMLAAAALASSGARAFTVRPYDKSAAQAAISAGKPVIVHVYAPWCLQCHMQESILDGLKNDPAYKGLTFYRVDYDGQKDVVKSLDCPRSTLIAYRGGKEVARMSWGVSEASVVDVLKAAL